MDSICNWRSGGGNSDHLHTLLWSIPSARATADCDVKKAVTSEVLMDADYVLPHMGVPIDSFNDPATFQGMEAIGERVRALRKRQGLTQVQLAKALGIDQSTLSDIERGAGFSAEVLVNLAHELGTTPEHIMRGEPVATIRLTPDETALILAYREQRQKAEGGHTLVQRKNDRAIPDAGIRLGRHTGSRLGPKPARKKA